MGILRATLALFLCMASVSAFAVPAELGIYFPASCPGSKKAARVFPPTVNVERGWMKISFDMALLQCPSGQEKFQPYEAQENEYVQVYEIYNLAGVSAQSPIVSNSGDKDLSQAAIRLPLKTLQPVEKDGTQTYQFRVDIFLYNQRLPLKLTVYPTGAATIETI